MQTLSTSPPSSDTGSIPLLEVSHVGPVVHIRLNRPEKRNSISDELLAQLHREFLHLPATTRVAVLSGEGAHFCAGLDLSEIAERTLSKASRTRAPGTPPSMPSSSAPSP